MMAVSIEVTGAGIETGTPRRLFAASMPRASGDTPFSYDVTADGQRFLIQQPTAVQSSPLTVVLNWQTRLRQQ